MIGECKASVFAVVCAVTVMHGCGDGGSSSSRSGASGSDRQGGAAGAAGDAEMITGVAATSGASGGPNPDGGRGGHAGSAGGPTEHAGGASGSTSSAGTGAAQGGAGGGESGGNPAGGSEHTQSGGASDAPSGGTSGTPSGGSAGDVSGQAGSSGSTTSAECTPVADTCPSEEYCADTNECTAGCKGDSFCASGAYCSVAHACVTGCNRGDACASGACSEALECVSCVSDAECVDGNRCGTGVCAAACADTAECVEGLTCCSEGCVDTRIDVTHCGGCGTACEATEFCGQSGCASAVFSNACESPAVAGLLAGDADDAATQVVVATLSSCIDTTRELAQATGGVINPTTGHPVARGELLVAFGGDFYQLLVGYLERERIAPVYSVYSDAGEWQYRLAATDEVVGSLPGTEIDGTHDIIVVELVRTPDAGTLALIGYGIDATGTAAAAWYFVNVLTPTLDASAESWYVVEWTDTGDDGPSDPSEFVQLGAGT